MELNFAASSARKSGVSLEVEVADEDHLSGGQERVASDQVAAFVLADSIWKIMI